MNVRRVILFSFLLLLPLQALNAKNVCTVKSPVYVKFTAPSATAIHGTVQYQTGKQVKGQVVMLSRIEKNPKLLQTIATDKEGQFHFDSVPEGKYSIAIYSAGTAKPTEVQCDANGSCNLAFTLKPPSLTLDCPRLSYDVEQQQPTMRGSIPQPK